MTRPAPGSTSGDAGTAARPLASLLAHGRKATELLPHLHQHALDATGGVCSLLFMIGMASDVARGDPYVGAVVGLWIICFFISAAGIALIYVARKRARAAATAKPGAEGSPPPP